MKRSALLAAAMFAIGAAGAYLLKEFRGDGLTHAIGTGPAPDFELAASDGDRVSIDDLRGKVVVLAFGFTRCGDICPMAVQKFTWMQDELGEAFGEEVHFILVTVDPEYDTPEVLAEYSQQIGADPKGWSFLTGTQQQVSRVTKMYGVKTNSSEDGLVEHILLTSLIDRDGAIGVQYLGERFRAEEMLADVRTLIAGDEIKG